MSDFIERTLKLVPQADPVVLDFIDKFVGHGTGKYGNISADCTIFTFSSGYCYYFAVILYTAFRRGTVCWAAPFGHIVWEDMNGVAYDIGGVYSGEAECLIPVSFMGDTLDDFLHIRGVAHNTTQGEIEKMMNNYKAWRIKKSEVF